MDSSNAGSGRHPGPRWWTALLVLILVLLPLSLDVTGSGGGHPAFRLRIPLADPVLLAALAFVFASRRRLDPLRWSDLAAPLPLVTVSLLATLPRLGMGASWTETVQRLDYFVLAYALMLALPIHGKVRTLAESIVIVTCFFACLAAIQLTFHAGSPTRITSLFQNRHLFAGWVAIALAVGCARWSWKRRRESVAIAVLLLLCLWTGTTVLPLVGAAVGLGVAAFSARARSGWWIATASLAGAAVVFVLLAPSSHVARSVEEWSFAEVDSKAALHRRGAEIDGLSAESKLASFPLRGREIGILLPNWHPAVEPPPDPRREDRFEPHYVRQRYLEWQAALNASAQSPVLGFGLGGYQAQVSRGYTTFKKLKLLEPDSQSAYTVELVSTGIAGLVALIGFLLVPCGQALRRLRSSDGSTDGGADARSGLAGLLAALIVGFAVPLFTCSLAVLAVLLAAAIEGDRASEGGSDLPVAAPPGVTRSSFDRAESREKATSRGSRPRTRRREPVRGRR